MRRPSRSPKGSRQRRWRRCGRCTPVHLDMVQKVFRKTVPFLRLDDRFDVRRPTFWRANTDMPRTTTRNSSTVFLLSGSVDGNRFYLNASSAVRWAFGHIPVPSSSIGRRRNGTPTGTAYEHHSQTLEASVTKPAPYYRYETDMIYGNERRPI